MGEASLPPGVDQSFGFLLYWPSSNITVAGAWSTMLIPQKGASLGGSEATASLVVFGHSRPIIV